ncbi:MAG: DUF6567 family protein [Chitinophagales bacterium]
MVKFILFICIVSACFISCTPVIYTMNYNQLSQTQVELSKANFKVLGSFVGQYSTKLSKGNIKNEEGLAAMAKKDLLKNAADAGVELVGSRALVNISSDFAQNEARISVTISADIIEFID